MTSTIPQTMTAWAQHRYGGPESVSPEIVAVPTPAAREVLLAVRATALNSADVRIMRGDPLLIRLAFGMRRPRTRVQGRDVAGTIVAVGGSPSGYAVGDVVVGEISGGGLADFAVARADRLIPVPATLSVEAAAAIPLAGGTAWQALDLGGVTAGSRVLVTGAGGGVGTFAVRLAVLRGAHVTALGGQRVLSVLEGLGAGAALDYRRTDVAHFDPSSFDAVIDIAGSAPLRSLQRITAEGGAIVLVSGGTNRVTGPLGRMLRAAALSIGSRRRIRSLAAMAKPEITRSLLALAAEGRLAPHIERIWPSAQTRDALAHIDSGHAVGKNVVTSDATYARIGYAEVVE